VQFASCSKDEDHAIFSIDVHFELSRDKWQCDKLGDVKKILPWTSELKDQIQEELEHYDIDGLLTFDRKFAFIGAGVNEIGMSYVQFD
jgi:hypothetical protein